MNKDNSRRKERTLTQKLVNWRNAAAVTGASLLSAIGGAYAQNTQLNVPEYGELNSIGIHQYVNDGFSLEKATGLSPEQVKTLLDGNPSNGEATKIVWNLKDGNSNLAEIYVGVQKDLSQPNNDIGGSTNWEGQQIIHHEVPTEDIVRLTKYTDGNKLQMTELYRLEKESSIQTLTQLNNLAKNGVNTTEKIDAMYNLYQALQANMTEMQGTLVTIAKNGVNTTEKIDAMTSTIDAMNIGLNTVMQQYGKQIDVLLQVKKLGEQQGLSLDEITQKMTDVSNNIVNLDNGLTEYLNTALKPVGQLLGIEQQILDKSNSLEQAVSVGNDISGQVKVELDSLKKYVEKNLGPVTEYLTGLNQELANMGNVEQAADIIKQYTQSNATKLDSITNATATANEKLAVISVNLETLLKGQTDLKMGQSNIQTGVDNANTKLNTLLNQTGSKKSAPGFSVEANLGGGYNVSQNGGILVDASGHAFIDIANLNGTGIEGVLSAGYSRSFGGSNADESDAFVAAGIGVSFPISNNGRVIFAPTAGYLSTNQSATLDGGISGDVAGSQYGVGAFLGVNSDNINASVEGLYFIGGHAKSTAYDSNGQTLGTFDMPMSGYMIKGQVAIPFKVGEYTTIGPFVGVKNISETTEGQTRTALDFSGGITLSYGNN